MQVEVQCSLRVCVTVCVTDVRLCDTWRLTSDVEVLPSAGIPKLGASCVPLRARGSGGRTVRVWWMPMSLPHAGTSMELRLAHEPWPMPQHTRREKK